MKKKINRISNVLQYFYCNKNLIILIIMPQTYENLVLNCINPVFEVSEVSVGQHFYWNIFGFPVHGQVLLTSWVVLTIIIVISFLGNSNLNQISKRFSKPHGIYYGIYCVDLAKTQIGEEEYCT